MKFSKHILKILIICALVAAAYQSAFAADEWRRVTSKNFQFVGSADEIKMRGVAVRLEQFRYVFTQLFPQMNFGSPIPTRVVVFRDKATFDRFKPVEWAAGYFQSGDDVNYIVLTTEGSEAENLTTIFHEYTHFLVNNSMGRANIPPWLNEGIAEYYEQFSIEDDRKVTLGSPTGAHLKLLQQSGFIPFATFLATDYYTLHKQTKASAQHFYAQSWLLAHYLLHGKNGASKPQFDKFVALLLRGIKVKDAFEQAYGADFATLETDLKNYAAKKNFAITVVPFKEKLVFDAEMQASAITDAEAKAFQGDLLYHSKRFDDAEKFLTEALASNSSSTAANTTLGLVKMQQKKYTEAKAFLEKAMSADSQNYLAFFNYALVLSREGMTEYGFASSYSPEQAEKIRANLRRAMSLNPNFAESYNLYGFINVVRNEEIDESIAYIKKALAIAPGNQWYSIRLAELYMRNEDFAAARDLARKIIQTAPDDFLKVYAENALRTINSLEAQMEAVKNYRKRPDPEEVTDKPLSDEEIARRREKALMESLNSTLRRAKPDEKRMLGSLTNIECQLKQVIFSFKSENETLQFRTESLETLRLMSFEPQFVNAEFGCGAMRKENLAVITYRPAADDKSKIAGELVAIEFVPKNFRFLGEKK